MAGEVHELLTARDLSPEDARTVCLVAAALATKLAKLTEAEFVACARMAFASLVAEA